MSHFNIPIFIPHLGCPFQCIFCNQKKITATQEIISDREIKNTIEIGLSTLPQDAEVEVAFFGGSFTAIERGLQQYYLNLVRPYIDKRLISGVRISTRPDFIDCAALDFLLDAGVTTIELGVQSLDDQVLQASGRGYASQNVEQAVKMIRKYPFMLGIQLMIGLPGDSREADLVTTALTIGLKPDMVRIYPTLVIEETPLAAMFLAGRYKPLSLPEAIGICLQMFLRFQQAEIKVIRMGLHPDEELIRSDTVMAGPFHAGFGELVQQEIYQEQVSLMLQELLVNEKNRDQIKLFVNRRDLSKLIGFRRSNLNHWKSKFDLAEILVQPCDTMARDEIGIGSSLDGFPLMQMTRQEFTTAYLTAG